MNIVKEEYKSIPVRGNLSPGKAKVEGWNINFCNFKTLGLTGKLILQISPYILGKFQIGADCW